MITKEDRTIEIALMRMGSNPSNIGSPLEVPDGLKILQDGEEPPSSFGCMRIMTVKDGDKRVVWDCKSMDQIREAEQMFEKLKGEGLVPYRVGTDGKSSSEEMTEFDPHVEEIIFLPMKAVAGG